MYCKKFMTFIERYRDKVLSVENRSACDEHLSACPRCSRALAEIERTTTLFAQALIPAAPVDLTADIMKSVRRDSADLESQTGIVLSQWWKEASLSARLAFALSLILIASAGFFASRDLWNGPAVAASPEFSEFDSFSESQKGSLEDAYLRLVQTSSVEEVR
jgi:anti-sigma factor RsiW